MPMIKKALISVSNKEGLEDFAKKLQELGISIISTGNTARAIRKSGVEAIDISDVTGFPEILDGRVKTLHPKVHAGLLAVRSNKDHTETLKRMEIEPIDMVVVNLYPFEKTIQKPNVTLEKAIENIDIGGPSMIRSAAKNFNDVVVIVDPNDYELIIEELKRSGGEVSLETRFSLAVKAFKHTSEYDGVIANYLKMREREGFSAGSTLFTDEQGNFKESIGVKWNKLYDVRYGENPHQKAAVYKEMVRSSSSILDAQVLSGKELSFNNLLDLQAAWSMAIDFKEPAAAIIKHNNPCGLATNKELSRAYEDALECDPVSAYGCVIAVNRRVDMEVARLIDETAFVEAMIAPGYFEDALELLKKKKNRRIVDMVKLPDENEKPKYEMRFVVGGMLVQEVDEMEINPATFEIVTEKKPSDNQLLSMAFAMKACKWIKSNAIVLVQGTRTVGIGAGQMSRVDSTELAIKKAGDRVHGSVLGSDAFFPFRDSIDLIAKQGVSAVVQPGGSKRDEEVIEACNEYGIAMAFTRHRHFRH